MKILVALSRFPYPLLKGDQLRAYYFLKELSQHHELYLLCLSDEDCQEHENHIKPFCKHLEVIQLSKIRQIRNLLTAIVDDIPFQVAYFKHPDFRTRFQELSQEIKPDICWAQLIRVGENISSNHQIPMYLDYMDCFSAGFRRRAFFSNWFMRTIIQVEVARLKRYEESISVHFQGYSIISEADKQAMPAAIRSNISVIPNGVSSYFLEEFPGKKDLEYLVIFTGNMGYHPNIEAARYLVNKIMPLVWQQLPAAKICIVGTNPSSEVLKLAHDKRVIVTGYVPDIRTWLQDAVSFVAPLFSGSGLQNKLLEAMAAGVPVITSTMANAALQAPNQIAILEAVTPTEFSQAILDLLNLPEKRKSIIKNAKEFVRERYHWPAIAQKLTSEFEKITHH
ncbi:MAG: glycosyltransferase [Bacteroidia bacterium]|nr:glycosyltransferase [Bacteroidia bacterium]